MSKSICEAAREEGQQAWWCAVRGTRSSGSHLCVDYGGFLDLCRRSLWRRWIGWRWRRRMDWCIPRRPTRPEVATPNILLLLPRASTLPPIPASASTAAPMVGAVPPMVGSTLSSIPLPTTAVVVLSLVGAVPRHRLRGGEGLASRRALARPNTPHDRARAGSFPSLKFEDGATIQI